MRHRVNEGCKVLGALKGVMKNRGLGMNVKKVLYEKVAVPTVMYGSESWGMKVTESVLIADSIISRGNPLFRP